MRGILLEKKFHNQTTISMKTKSFKDDSAKLSSEIPFQVEQQTEGAFFPFIFRRSGYYLKSLGIKVPEIFPVKPAIPTIPRGGVNQVSVNLDALAEDEKQSMNISPFLVREEFRLDVDGRYPQMTASGYIKYPGVHYVAKLSRRGFSNIYDGKIWYKYGQVNSFPYTKLVVTVTDSYYRSSKKVKVEFSGPGKARKTSIYQFQSHSFRNVNFEYDYEQGVQPTLDYDLQSHPNRPASLPNSNLTVDNVFRQAGFGVTRANDNSVPSALKGANGRWSNMEMHDAMQSYWSRFNAAPNWALWTFLAKQHEIGYDLGGIMFDTIGTNHRQGTAVFYDSFINRIEPGETNPAAQRERMKLWTTVHEMGHSFNLAHSWQKALGTPWIPLANEPEARSFMNYPYLVNGGVPQFFSDFEYRFSDDELLFMRHAPAQFVQMGNNEWFEDHGFQDQTIPLSDEFSLEIRVNRPMNTVEYMEPVYIEMKLTNISGQTQEVEERILQDVHHLYIQIQKPNGEVCEFKSFVKYLFEHTTVSLKAGESIYNSMMISAGTDDWYIKESGNYQVTMNLIHHGERTQSNVLNIYVKQAASEGQMALSQDYFCDDVARVLFFNGSRVLTDANQTLQNVLEVSPDSNSAIHAAVALANPKLKDYNLLEFGKDNTFDHQCSAAEMDGKVKVVKQDIDAAKSLLEGAMKDVDKVLDTYGHIKGEEQMINYGKTVNDGDIDDWTNNLLDKFKDRGVSEKICKQIGKKIKASRK